MYSYAIKRIGRSWALFLAFFLGLTLAVALFTGTWVGADAIGAQTLQTALTNVPVDIVSAKTAKNFTSSSIDTSLASISALQQSTGVEISTEAMYRISAQVVDLNENFTAFFPIIALSSQSTLLNDAVFSSTQGVLSANQTIIEEGSINASRYSVGDTLTLRIRVQSQTTKQTYYFPYNLTLADRVQISDSAFSIIASTSAGRPEFLLRQLILGGQLRRPAYSLMIINNQTLFSILTAIYHENALPADNVGIGLLTWLDHTAIVTPWDIEQSTADLQTIQALISNSIRGEGYTSFNLLTITLNAIQQLTNGLKIGFVVLALPVIFTAWYMGRTVSDVSLNLRRREIGLLLTKGFSKNQVLRLFLSETVLLSLIAGVLGIVLGVAILPLVNLETTILGGFQLLDVYTIAMAMIFSAAIAILSIVSPARRASSINTIDAIREYAPEESEAKLKIRWPLVALSLGTYKIMANILGFNLSAYAAPGRNLFLALLFGIARFTDQMLGYVAPVLFFWGFSKIFIQGSFKLQELIGKISSHFASGISEIATGNARLNTRRTAAVAFLLALIVGYGVSVIGGLASTNDYIQRGINTNVGADISIQMFSETNTTLVKSLVDSFPEVSSSTIERWMYVGTSFGTIQARVIDPSPWQNTAYYESNWFTGTRVADAMQELNSNNETIILDKSVADEYGLTVGQTISVSFGFTIYPLRIVGVFGVEEPPAAVIPQLRPGILPVTQQQATTFWSYIPEGLYNQTSFAEVAQTRILVKLSPGADGAELAEAIADLNANIERVDAVDAQQQLIDENIFLSGPRRVQALGVPFALLTASVGVVLLEITTLRERKKEITLMAVKGFSYLQIVKVQLLENLGIFIFSILLGTAVGYVTTISNVQSQNTTIALVARRVVFPLDSMLTVLAIVGIVLASIIVPILVMTRKYSTSLEWRVRG